MLTKENKKKLRAMAHKLHSNVQIGKSGLQGNVLEAIKTELEAHELVKVTLLKSAQEDVNEASIACANETDSQIIQKVGRTFVLYRQSKENKLGIYS